MDTTAISLCMDNRLPIIVYNLKRKGNLKRVVTGETIGTLGGGVAMPTQAAHRGCQDAHGRERWRPCAAS